MPISTAPRRRRTFSIVTVAAVALGAMLLCAFAVGRYMSRFPRGDPEVPSQTAPVAATVAEARYAELQPLGLTNCNLERFGEANDGGYLLCANNNHTCDPAAAPHPAHVYEVLFVSKRLASVDPSAPTPVRPHPLNAPNDLFTPDCQN